MGRKSGGGGRSGRQGAGGTGGAVAPAGGATALAATPASAPAMAFTSTGGRQVEVVVTPQGANRADLTFTIDGSPNWNLNIPKPERNQIALSVMQRVRADAQSRPDGFQYRTLSTGRDEFSQRRSIAATAAGFSRPQGGGAGAYQYGVVRGGKIRPDTQRLNAEEQRVGLTRYRTTAALDSAWQDTVRSYRTLSNQDRVRRMRNG